ncbi:MAG: hypothetical protein R3F43_24730 [bacterium]
MRLVRGVLALMPLLLVGTPLLLLLHDAARPPRCWPWGWAPRRAS